MKPIHFEIEEANKEVSQVTTEEIKFLFSGLPKGCETVMCEVWSHAQREAYRQLMSEVSDD